MSSKVIVHYNPQLPIILAVDASAYGIAAVISHKFDNGDVKPIAYASRTLSSAEKSYSQIDKEALAIVYGVKKFHQFLYGRSFTLLTDHKPLISSFGDKKGIPIFAASRLQRWSVILSTYNFKIKFINSESNGNADALSRLPIEMNVRDEVDLGHILYIEENIPINHQDIAAECKKDPVLNRIIGFCLHGWPHKDNLDKEFATFYEKHKLNEIHIVRGCVLWGYRIIIPQQLRPNILKELHLSHLGINKCKSLARSYVWWPNIDYDIEQMCKRCMVCSTIRPNVSRTTLNPWPIAHRPWSRLHIDFLGPLNGQKYLIVIDAHTKWLEVIKVNSTTADNIASKLMKLFSQLGWPDSVVSDNGPPFTSSDFKTFLKNNGIRQLFTPPYHPQSNGAAENAVKLIKQALKKRKQSIIRILFYVVFLLDYRNSEHSSTGISPAKAMFGRNLKNRLDLIMPNRYRTVEEKVIKQVENFGGRNKVIEVDDKVIIKDYTTPTHPVGMFGKIANKRGSVLLDVETSTGKNVIRHSDQIRVIEKNNNNRNSLLVSTWNKNDEEVKVEVDKSPSTSQVVPDLTDKTVCVDVDNGPSTSSQVISDVDLVQSQPVVQERYQLRPRK
ncbi:uncharacterized protein K02A2.6-like [Photinus pyralis]|uniref:uncharacterized protein K02A2.6-like n=1 Tax=Photinus pyralis TaxID=7054 RepID=UPI00126721AE|nr:uncharacterized protein K02A2.6-like [Photinus pyralis]